MRRLIRLPFLFAVVLSLNVVTGCERIELPEETGAYLKYLLARVQSGNLNNSRDELLAAARHRRTKTETAKN